MRMYSTIVQLSTVLIPLYNLMPFLILYAYNKNKMFTIIKKIEVETCEDCPYCKYSWSPSYSYHYCDITKKRIFDYHKTIMPWCPEPKQIS